MLPLMAIDVVIPLFNGGRYIEETLEGAFVQGAELGDVVVIDDGSTDDGVERVRRFGRGIRVLSSQPGVRPRRTGLLATARPLVAFLDQDDVWHPEHLERLLAALDAEPTAPASASAVMTFQDGDLPRHELRSGKPRKIDPWEQWPFGCPIWTPSSVLFRRAPLVAVEAWNRAPKSDWQAYLRIARHAPIVGTRSATCAYRLHPGDRPGVRRPDGPSRLDSTVWAVEAAFELRMATEDDETARATLERRYAVYGEYITLLRALEHGDEDQVGASARALEHDLTPESDRFLFKIVEHAFYLCRSDDGLDETLRLQRDFLDRLKSALPDDALLMRGVSLAQTRQAGARRRRFFRYLLKGRWPTALRGLAGSERR